MKRKIYEILAGKCQARINCIESKNDEWFDRHEEAIEMIIKNHLPSGSGFDSGTKFDYDKSHGNKLVFISSYHKMNEDGYYCGWFDFVITITPDFVSGFDMKDGRMVK